MAERTAALRRKLDALAYREPLEPGSAALAGRLLADLVASWRALKLRDAARAQQLAAFQAQARRPLGRPSSASRRWPSADNASGASWPS